MQTICCPFAVVFIARSNDGTICSVVGTGSQCEWYRLAMRVVQARNASGTGSQCEWYRLAMRVQSLGYAIETQVKHLSNAMKEAPLP